MNKPYRFRTWRNALLILLLTTLSSLASASEKHYTVTAPDGVKIAVQESGNPTGPAIIFIHGLLGSRLNWEKQVNSPELQNYRMITYDLRGHGMSGKPEDAEAYRNGRHYADDLAAVLKSTGARRPVLVGWSLGGVVMSNYLAAYGDAGISGVMYVDGVIELNAALITPHPEVYAGLASDDVRTHLEAERAFLSLCFHTQPDAVTRELLLSSAAMASWVMTRTTPSMTVAAAEGLPKARVPVLMIYGGKDQLVKVQPSIARARELNDISVSYGFLYTRIARARELNDHVQTKLYANSGHAPFLEEAPRFNRDLSAFMTSAAVNGDAQ